MESKKRFIARIFYIVVFSGLFGWVYEFIFYYFNFGMDKFYWQGGNFLPWINIYAYGALLIYLLTYKFTKNPWKVFFINVISTGILEFVSGYAIYTLFDGTRYWDYNKEILNFMNIGGFVCLRSVLFFGVSGLILMYWIIPFLKKLENKVNLKIYFNVALILFSIVMFDELYNLIFARLFNLPRMHDVYLKLGVNFMKL